MSAITATQMNPIEGIVLRDFQSFNESIPQEIARVLATREPLLEAQKKWGTAFKITAVIAVVFLCCGLLVPESLFLALCFGGAGFLSLYCKQMKWAKERAWERAEMDPCIAGLALYRFRRISIDEYHHFFDFVRRSTAGREAIELREFIEFNTAFSRL